ncbi:MAG: RluA family pseudouridine synthase [Candidatus Omnitrophota bacterium]|nr:RluA family pseudouridine synthase [Candidatus Omnitrophota bacterium]
MYNFEVILEDNGKRVDNVSLKHLVGVKPELEISRTVVQDMIDKGEILLNGKKVKVSHKVNTGDKIEIDLEKLEKESLAEHCKKIPRAEKLPLNIIYEDDDILVINKPAGMVVHPACGNYSGTLVNALLNYDGFLTEFNEPRDTKDEKRVLRPGIVHRLDKDTSGVILVAKTGVALRKISGQLKNRTITKKYIAVVKGIIELEEGIIDLPINHDKKNRMKMAIDRYNGKDAVTQYKVLSRNKEKNFTVLEVTPKTGRTHQIRIHLAHVGHPILGDTLYNGPNVQGLSRQALHAKSISFIHPSKNIQVEFSAKIPLDIQQFLSSKPNNFKN